MRRAIGVFLFLAGALLLHGASDDQSQYSRYGFLVDSGCYDSMERNVNPFDQVNRDRGEEVLFCIPNLKTKAFTLVQPNGMSYKLDAAGNQKAAELFRQVDKKARRMVVSVTGEMVRSKINVDSITLVPERREFRFGND